MVGDGLEHSRSFRTKAEGERYRSLLTHAKTVGEPFDDLSGEPLSWRPGPLRRPSSHLGPVLVGGGVAGVGARTRASAMEALVRFVPLLVAPDASALRPA